MNELPTTQTRLVIWTLWMKNYPFVPFINCMSNEIKILITYSEEGPLPREGPDVICNLSFPKWRLRQISLTLFPDAQMDGKWKSWQCYRVSKKSTTIGNNTDAFKKNKGTIISSCFLQTLSVLLFKAICLPQWLPSSQHSRLKVCEMTSIQRHLLCKLLHLSIYFGLINPFSSCSTMATFNSNLPGQR